MGRRTKIITEYRQTGEDADGAGENIVEMSERMGIKWLEWGAMGTK